MGMPVSLDQYPCPESGNEVFKQGTTIHNQSNRAIVRETRKGWGGNAKPHMSTLGRGNSLQHYNYLIFVCYRPGGADGLNL
jgi:hypothetical protein